MARHQCRPLGSRFACEASTNALCIHCCWQELPHARHRRMLSAYIVAANCQLVSEEGLQALYADCPGFAAHGRRKLPAGQQGGSSGTLSRRPWFAAHRCCELPAGQRGGHFMPPLVCSTSSLRMASWSARRAFRRWMPSSRVCSTWTLRIASWCCRVFVYSAELSVRSAGGADCDLAEGPL